MAAADEDALRCDFAETYSVLDYRRLPLRTAAVFAWGLPENSRIKRHLSGAQTDLETALLARLCDGVAMIAWMLSEDGPRNRNRPKSILQELLGADPTDRAQVYARPADFRAAWKQINEGGEGDA